MYSSMLRHCVGSELMCKHIKRNFKGYGLGPENELTPLRGCEYRVAPQGYAHADLEEVWLGNRWRT